MSATKFVRDNATGFLLGGAIGLEALIGAGCVPDEHTRDVGDNIRVVKEDTNVSRLFNGDVQDTFENPALDFDDLPNHFTPITGNSDDYNEVIKNSDKHAVVLFYSTKDLRGEINCKQRSLHALESLSELHQKYGEHINFFTYDVAQLGGNNLSSEYFGLFEDTPVPTVAMYTNGVQGKVPILERKPRKRSAAEDVLSFLLGGTPDKDPNPKPEEEPISELGDMQYFKGNKWSYFRSRTEWEREKTKGSVKGMAESLFFDYK